MVGNTINRAGGVVGKPINRAGGVVGNLLTERVVW